MLKNFCEEKFDIVIQAGQSNSQGYGIGDAEKPYVANENVWFLNNDFTISTAQERISENFIVSDFSLSFAREYIQSGRLENGRKLLIVRAAVGGTGFLDNRWKLTDDLYLRMIAMTETALSLNKSNRLIAFLWHQGETDAMLDADKQTHYNNLSTLINSFRTTFGCEKLPFIAGDFVPEWKNKNATRCQPVTDAIKEVCTNVGCAKFIETDELESNSQKSPIQDDIHFCRESLYRLGVKYYKAFESLDDN